MKLLLILIGIIFFLFGIFLTFAITLYSLKEGDNEGFYGLGFSFALVGLGIFIFVKGFKQKHNQ